MGQVFNSGGECACLCSTVTLKTKKKPNLKLTPTSFRAPLLLTRTWSFLCIGEVLSVGKGRNSRCWLYMPWLPWGRETSRTDYLFGVTQGSPGNYAKVQLLMR